MTTVLASAAAVVVAPAAALAAVPGLTYVSAATSLDSTVYKSIRLFCPAGTQVIGGGFDLRGAEGAVVLDDFIPSATDLLIGAGEIVGPGEPSDGTTTSWQIVGTAVCANPLPGYSIQSRTSDFKQATSQGASVSCPPGRVHIGGGASLSNGWGQVSIRELSIGGTTARAETDNDGYSGKWSVTAYAICADALPGYVKIETSSFTDTTMNKVQPSYCPAGKPVIGAGWKYTQTFDDGIDRYVTRAAITSTNFEPNVTAAATALGADKAWAVRATAVCADV